MKTTQVLALGAMLVAQTQACTKVHVETWRDGNGADQVEVLVFRDNDPMRTMERIADGETSLRFKDPANFLTQVSLTAVGVPKGSKGGRRIKGTFSFENFDSKFCPKINDPGTTRACMLISPKLLT